MPKLNIVNVIVVIVTSQKKTQLVYSVFIAVIVDPGRLFNINARSGNITTNGVLDINSQDIGPQGIVRLNVTVSSF